MKVLFCMDFYCEDMQSELEISLIFLSGPWVLCFIIEQCPFPTLKELLKYLSGLSLYKSTDKDTNDPYYIPFQN